MKRVLVAGGTGLVGSNLLRALSAEPDFLTTVLVRKKGAAPNFLPGIVEQVFDFDKPSEYGSLAKQEFDLAFCCLGTTRRKAGSDEKFRRVDFEYPVAILESLREKRCVFGLVSSVGAERPVGLYLETKADLERELVASGMIHVIVRPSLLLGSRSEFRPLEFASTLALGWLQDIMRDHMGEKIARYAPVHASVVAKALLNGAKICEEKQKNMVLEGRELASMGVLRR